MLDKALTAVSELESAYHTWKVLPLVTKKEVIARIKEKLLTHTEQYARAITTDMNKPLAQSVAEVKKCATLCEYYLSHIELPLLASISCGYSQPTLGKCIGRKACLQCSYRCGIVRRNLP